MPESPRERLIKRYDNRKLYDPARKSYLTLSELPALVAAGQELRVVDQASGDDITSTVLAQAMLEALKQKTLDIPRQVLVRLIRLGMAARPQTTPAATPGEPLARARDEAERIVAGVLQRGRLPLEEALVLRQEIVDSLRGLAHDVERRVESRFGEVLRWAENQRGLVPPLKALRARLFARAASLDETQKPRAPKRPAKRRRRR
jgi:polyhydroxyalkanoate synthesis repressor PhaR